MDPVSGCADVTTFYVKMWIMINLDATLCLYCSVKMLYICVKKAPTDSSIVLTLIHATFRAQHGTAIVAYMYQRCSNGFLYLVDPFRCNIWRPPWDRKCCIFELMMHRLIPLSCWPLSMQNLAPNVGQQLWHICIIEAPANFSIFFTFAAVWGYAFVPVQIIFYKKTRILSPFFCKDLSSL